MNKNECSVLVYKYNKAILEAGLELLGQHIGLDIFEPFYICWYGNNVSIKTKKACETAYKSIVKDLYEINSKIDSLTIHKRARKNI